AAAGVRGRLGLRTGLGVEALRLDGAVRVAAATTAGGRRRTGWWRGRCRRGSAAGGVDGDIVHVHRYAGLRGAGRSTAERGREAATHRHVQDDEEAVVRGVVPGGRVDLVRVEGEEGAAVQGPADLLG